MNSSDVLSPPPPAYEHAHHAHHRCDLPMNLGVALRGDAYMGSAQTGDAAAVARKAWRLDAGKVRASVAGKQAEQCAALCEHVAFPGCPVLAWEELCAAVRSPQRYIYVLLPLLSTPVSAVCPYPLAHAPS